MQTSWFLASQQIEQETLGLDLANKIKVTEIYVIQTEVLTIRGVREKLWTLFPEMSKVVTDKDFPHWQY